MRRRTLLKSDAEGCRYNFTPLLVHCISIYTYFPMWEWDVIHLENTVKASAIQTNEDFFPTKIQNKMIKDQIVQIITISLLFLSPNNHFSATIYHLTRPPAYRLYLCKIPIDEVVKLRHENGAQLQINVSFTSINSNMFSQCLFTAVGRSSLIVSLLLLWPTWIFFILHLHLQRMRALRAIRLLLFVLDWSHTFTLCLFFMSTNTVILFFFLFSYIHFLCSAGATQWQKANYIEI